MPELPDVEVFKEVLDRTALDRTVQGVEVHADRVLCGVSARALRSRLQGRPLRATRRHGKHLFARASRDGWLRLHFGMTGQLRFGEGGDGVPAHTRLLLRFTGGAHLAYVNVRRFGEIGWVDDIDRFIRDRGLGPDALELGLDGFREVLGGRRGAVKSTLMNQAVLAGIGNIYADEILFQAKIHPRTAMAHLDDRALGEVHRATRAVLRAAIRARVDRFPRWFMLPHRDTDMTCPRCGAGLVKTRLAGRATIHCPREQKPPRG